MKRIYLDYATTTPTHPDVVEAMLPYFTESFGNPSSIHSYGQEVRGAVEVIFITPVLCENCDVVHIDAVLAVEVCAAEA